MILTEPLARTVYRVYFIKIVKNFTSQSRFQNTFIIDDGRKSCRDSDLTSRSDTATALGIGWKIELTRKGLLNMRMNDNLNKIRKTIEIVKADIF